MKRIIKDPTFNIYSQGGAVEKALEGRGDLSEKEELLKLADMEKERFDFEIDLIQTLREKYKEERKDNQTFSDWLKSKPDDYLRRISMDKGGKVINFIDYAKMKEPKVKKLDLASLFADHAKTIASLTPQERDAVNDLLKRTMKHMKD
jgi:hypothetical protein|tara:strand:+ start:1883 stop:2326 length:444 start_codon:yes stop_codon:yes gene_type:complete